MAETLIGRISTLPGIVVQPVGAVQRYAVPEQDPLVAGRELGADAVLAASLVIGCSNDFDRAEYPGAVPMGPSQVTTVARSDSASAT